jgi:hypothetical protein
MDPTPPASPRRSPARWRLIALILAALPTMLIAGLAAWILSGILDLHGHMGAWHVTVRDGHGATVGNGDLDLKPMTWTWHWSWHPPFASSIPIFSPEPCGTLALPYPVMTQELGGTTATGCRLIGAQFTWSQATGRPSFVVMVEPSPPVNGYSNAFAAIFWPDAPGTMPGVVLMQGSSQDQPLTVDLSR